MKKKINGIPGLYTFEMFTKSKRNLNVSIARGRFRLHNFIENNPVVWAEPQQPLLRVKRGYLPVEPPSVYRQDKRQSSFSNPGQLLFFLI